MSNQEVSVKFTADEAQLWNAMQKIIGGAMKLGDGVERAGKKGKESSAEMKRFAEMVNRVSTTPIDRYNDRMARLKKLADETGMSKEKVARAVAHFHRELERENAALERNAHAAGRSGAAQRQFHDGTMSAGEAATKIAGSVSGLAASYVSFQSALSFANQYLDEHNEKITKTLDAHRSLAEVQEAAFKNLTGLSPGDKIDVHKRALEITKETGVSTKVVEDAVGGVYSVVGDVGVSEESVRVAARENPLRESAVGEVSLARAMIGQAAGVEDAEKVAGFHLLLQSKSAVKDNARLGKAVVPLLSAGRQMYSEAPGEDVATQFAAGHAVLTQLGGDTEGLSARTSMIAFAQKVDRYFDERPELKAIAPTFLEQVRMIQNDETGDMRREILGKEGIGEKQFQSTIEAIVTKGTQAAQMFEEASSTIKFDATVHQDAVRDTRLTASQRMAIAEKRNEAATELSKLGDPELAETEVTRQISSAGLHDTRRSAGEWVYDKIADARRWIEISDEDRPAFDDMRLRERMTDRLREGLGLAPRDALGGDPYADNSLRSDFAHYVHPDARQKLTLIDQLVDTPELTVEMLTTAGIEDQDIQRDILDLHSRRNLIRDMRQSEREAEERIASNPGPAVPAPLPPQLPPEVRDAVREDIPAAEPQPAPTLQRPAAPPKVAIPPSPPAAAVPPMPVPKPPAEIHEAAAVAAQGDPARAAEIHRLDNEIGLWTARAMEADRRGDQANAQSHRVVAAERQQELDALLAEPRPATQPAARESTPVVPVRPAPAPQLPPEIRQAIPDVPPQAQPPAVSTRLAPAFPTEPPPELRRDAQEQATIPIRFGPRGWEENTDADAGIPIELGERGWQETRKDEPATPNDENPRLRAQRETAINEPPAGAASASPAVPPAVRPTNQVSTVSRETALPLEAAGEQLVAAARALTKAAERMAQSGTATPQLAQRFPPAPPRDFSSRARREQAVPAA